MQAKVEKPKTKADPNALTQFPNSLPQEIKEQVSKLDLLEFLGAMMQTGHAKESQLGVFQLRHPDHPRFVVTFV